MWIFYKLEISSESKIFGSKEKAHLVTIVSQMPYMSSWYRRVSEKWKELIGPLLPTTVFLHDFFI